MINYQKSAIFTKSFASKAELKEQLYGKDNRTSYTKQQLIRMGFKEEYILGRYFEQSSYNILDQNITLKMKRGLQVNDEELKTIYELLNALNKGYEITFPTSKPELKTEFYRVTENVPTQVDRTADTYQVNGLTKAELCEIIYGKDSRLSYTKQQLIEMGFKEEYILGRYFEQSSENILDTNITLKMKRGLKVDNKELKTIYELLDALNNGDEVTFPTSKPEFKTKFYRKS